ncbi:MAG: hypothetical protein J0I12_02270 [Candidatus Eremiobacteraeota bacterium]|nr:hypothetical protein [Candidatus Eremiobacteraeota bacterium]
MDQLYPDEIDRMIDVACKIARERGASFPLPATVREAHKPVTHWEVLSAPEGQERTCIMLDQRGQFLNLERRPLETQPSQAPWWKNLLNLKK